jgi:hypothetical protein
VTRCLTWNRRKGFWWFTGRCGFIAFASGRWLARLGSDFIIADCQRRQTWRWWYKEARQCKSGKKDKSVETILAGLRLVGSWCRTFLARSSCLCRTTVPDWKNYVYMCQLCTKRLASDISTSCFTSYGSCRFSVVFYVADMWVGGLHSTWLGSSLWCVSCQRLYGFLRHPSRSLRINRM